MPWPKRHDGDEKSAKMTTGISARGVLELERVRSTIGLDSADQVRQRDDQADNDSSDIE